MAIMSGGQLMIFPALTASPFAESLNHESRGVFLSEAAMSVFWITAAAFDGNRASQARGPLRDFLLVCARSGGTRGALLRCAQDRTHVPRQFHSSVRDERKTSVRAAWSSVAPSQ